MIKKGLYLSSESSRFTRISRKGLLHRHVGQELSWYIRAVHQDPRLDEKVISIGYIVVLHLIPYGAHPIPFIRQIVGAKVVQTGSAEKGISESEKLQEDQER